MNASKQRSDSSVETGLLRDRFPLLDEKTYLSSHTLGAVPRSTSGQLQSYFDEWNRQGILSWEGPWWETLESFCREIEGVIGADKGTVAPMQNATRGMAGVASCFTYEEPKNKILMTDLEFVTSYSFWHRLEELGARIEIVESDDGISVSPEKLIDAIDSQTLLVPTCHAYFRSGAVQDLQPIVEEAHQHNAYVIGDGYQLVGVKPVNVSAMNIDFYVGGSHKWLCGGPGAGYLYVRPDLLEHLQPRVTGWFGLEDPFSFDMNASRPGKLNENALKFLDGTPNVPGLYAAIDGVRTVREAGVERASSISNHLTSHLYEKAEEEGFEVNTPPSPEERNGMLCIDVPDGERVREELVERNIIVDWRPQCGLRVSAHFYNTKEDLNQFWNELLEVVRQD